MLNIGRLAPDGEAYYLSTVAAGAEEYYTGAGEAPGFWLTEAAAGLGLAGRVAPDHLRKVLGARHPQTGDALPRTSRRRVPGFDLAFRAPKSVALVWALADDATASVVRDAHDQAVAAAIGYLERHAAGSRRGRAHERLAIGGLVAAAFRHRTSRAGDPLLHTHVLVANLGLCPDGQWRTLDARRLYSHAKTAGYLYQAALREQLSRRLGVAWTQVRNGTAEVHGVPREVITAFSQRRRQILAHLAERGHRSAKAAQAATLDTRAAKTGPGTGLRETWAARAGALGFDAADVAGLLGVARPTGASPAELAAAAEHLAGPQGLTARASTFTRRDVIQAWCEQLPAGASVAEVERLTDAVLDPDAGIAVPLVPTDANELDTPGGGDRQVEQIVDALAGRLDPAAAEQLRASTALRQSIGEVLTCQGWDPSRLTATLLERELDSAEEPDAVLAWRAQRLAARHRPTAMDGVDRSAVIRRGDGRVVRADAGERRYSTPELLALEQRLVDQAVARRDTGVAVADSDRIDAAITRRPSIAGEQAAMVRRLTTSGAGVDVVVGKAGAGKTYALDAARDAWQASGMRVVGTALAARAAAELHAGAGIDSYTIDALLGDLDRAPTGAGLDQATVVVVDEAGMVGTRKLARLLDHAHTADTKVVLVGDHRQLPEIDAGGVLRGLLHRLNPVALADNRRQHQPWERAALDQLRAGDPAVAVAAYADAGHLVVADTADAVRDRLVADWWTAWEQTGPTAGVMIAARVSDVADLNDRARARLHVAGTLTGPELVVEEHGYRQGDRIVTLNNDRRLGVLNGTRATVTRVDPGQQSLLATTDEGQEIRLPAAYLLAGHVTHAYAITGHKAQGLTTERAWVLGSDELYREWGYVAMSRGRKANRLYVVAGDASLDADVHCHAPEPARDNLAWLATALERSRGQALAVDHTTASPEPPPTWPAERGRLEQLLAAAPPNPNRELAWIAEEHDAARAQLHAAQQRLDHARARLDSLPRRGRGPAGRSAREQAEHAQTRARADLARWQQRLTDIDERAHRLEAAADRRETWLADHADDLAAARDHVTRDEAAIRRRVQAAEFRTPAYLQTAIGQRPADPAERRAWRAAVTAIERYRAHHDIDDPQQALGDPPDQPQQAAAYQRVMDAIHAVEVARDHALTHDTTTHHQLDLG